MNAGQTSKPIHPLGAPGDPTSTTLASTVFQSDDFLSKRYDLVRQIGDGGMSAVYLARDRQLDRPVAVKVMLPFDDEDAETYTIRFVNEARILARLNHPNIVHVYDFAATESGLRIIMEYVEGRTLYQQVSQDGALPEADVASVACEVLDALDVIHSEDVIHRDIKPGNVMLDPRGRVKVMDFGIAMTDAGDDDRTSESSVVGTMKFMAPEQSRGETVTVRADLFAVGATMAYMLLGSLPQILSPSDLPPRLRPVLVRAMAADPATRYGSSLEMREAIQAAMAAEPPAPPQHKRRLLPLLILAGLGLGVGVVMAGLLLAWELIGNAPAADRAPTGFNPPEIIFGEEEEPILIEDVEGEVVDEEAAVAVDEASSEARVIEVAPPPAETGDEPAAVTEAPATDEPMVTKATAEPPSIKHRALREVPEGEPARFEVRVVGDLTYEVLVTYCNPEGDNWRTLELRYRGDQLHTGNLRIGGDIAEGFSYYINVMEVGGTGQIYSRGSTAEPFDVWVR